MSINRRALRVTLSETAWRAHAEPLPGFTFIGTVSHGPATSGLAVDAAGRYFAVTGRALSRLTTAKVLAAIAASETPKG